MHFFYPSREYLRPWKLASLAAGIALLVLGSILTPALDWDIPISFIMALCTYLSLRTLLERNWRNAPLALFSTWFSVDGCYALYWHFKNPAALDAMRSANAPASLALYGICGVLWLYRGSLKALLAEVRAAVRHDGR
ncbi:MAG: hypothetical protein JSR70_00400 [Proteobacteria bacterium]|nr:hypothetical protein [Pseudomonadota bacterium]